MGTLALARTSAHVVAAATIGFVSWNGNVAALALLPAVAWIWRESSSRAAAFCALLAYYLAAGHGLLMGASVFFRDPLAPPAWWAGILVWTVPSTLLAATWATGWGTSFRGLRLLGILAVLALPPIGLVGWANPMTAAGALFPGAGWTGLLLTLGLLVVVVETKRLALLPPFILFAVVLNSTFVADAFSPNGTTWIGLDTQYGPTSSTADEFERLQGLRRAVMKASREASDGTVFLLPEAVGGDWTLNGAWWHRVDQQLQQRGQTLVIGAKRPAGGSRQYVNLLVSIGHDKGVELPSRVPVPLGMWTPHRDDGAKALWWAAGVAPLHGARVASLVCYEQLLVWPVLVSMVERPEVLLGASNDWWAAGTNIPKIQRQVVTVWARLFGLPTVYAVNL